MPDGARTPATWVGAAGPVEHVVDARWIPLRDERERVVADVFTVAYLAEGGGTDRPVTFVFNGGPGASSAYLHVGALGPRRVSFDDAGQPLAPPSGLVDNAESWLAFTDLVFVDPVGTGWSRAATPAGKADDDAPDPKAFFGVQKDLDSLVEVMSRWLSTEGRWTSPLFVAGESYGGYRAAKLARLCNERGLGLNGAVLISPALEFALLDASDYDVLPWIDVVPTMAISAHHHGRSRVFGVDVDVDVEVVRAEAEAFATGPLATLLIRGASTPAAERAEVLDRLADLLGLDPAFVERREGRIGMTQFARELLADEGRVVGIYDTTVTGLDPFPDRDGMAWPDPTLSGIERVFAGGINSLLRHELDVATDRDYRLLSMEVNRQWRIDIERHALEHQVGAADDLRYGMALNPHMRVYLTHGLHDLVTPYFSSERIRNLLRLDPVTASALTTTRFAGGHMFYARAASRVAFRDSIERFYADALG